MRFTLQSFDPFLHWLTLAIVCLLPVLAAFVLYKLGSLPGSIARQRGHPQASAINICGWMGLITLVLWPVAMVWAYLEPSRGHPADALPEAEILSRLRQASARVAGLERRLAERSVTGLGTGRRTRKAAG